MPAESKSQQRLMAMVKAYQEGKTKTAPKKVKEVAKHITPAAAGEFAATGHEGLPEKKASLQLLAKVIKVAAVMQATPSAAGDPMPGVGNDPVGAFTRAFARRGHTSAATAGARLAIKNVAKKRNPQLQTAQPAVQPVVQPQVAAPQAGQPAQVAAAQPAPAAQPAAAQPAAVAQAGVPQNGQIPSVPANPA